MVMGLQLPKNTFRYGSINERDPCRMRITPQLIEN